MALRHAIIEATVPNTGGVQSYTSPALSDWDSSGWGMIFLTGDTGDLTFHGFLSVGQVDFSGSQFCHAMVSVDGSTGLPENKEADIDDHCGILLDPVAGTAWGSLARVAFSSALPNGVELNWTDVAGVGSRVFKIVLVLIEGFLDVAVRPGNTSFVHGFDAHAMLNVPNGNGSIGPWDPAGRNANEVCPGLGGAKNDGGIIQRCSYVVNDRNQDPLVSRGRRSTSTFSHSSNGTTEFAGTVTAFNATSVSVTGTARGSHAAFRGPGGAGDFRFCHEALDGSTGLKFFSGLGARCNLVIGFVSGLTSDDTFEADSAALAPFAFFVTDGATTLSFGFSQRHNGVAISAGNPTDTYSSRSSGSILVLDHLNATEFLATVAQLTDTGLALQVSNGMSGTMTLFGFRTSPTLEFPDPVALDLEVPVVTVSGVETPDPVPIGFAVPPPHLAIYKPAPVVLGFNVPAVVVLETEPFVPPPEETPRPPLADGYGRGLLDLLPRGLAWTRDPSTVLGRLLRAIASELELLEYRGQDLVREADARLTHELLAEWEEFLRTRIDCPDLGASEIERRFAVVLRLATPGGQNAFHYSEVAKALGYDVEVEDFVPATPFLIEVSPVGYPLFDEQWAHVVFVHAPVVSPIFFRVGLSQVGDPLTTGNNDRLRCELDRIKPAHVLFVYVFDKPYTGFSPWTIFQPAPVVLRLEVPIPEVLP